MQMRSRIRAAYNNNDKVVGCLPNGIGSAPASGSILHQKLVQKVSLKSMSQLEFCIKHKAFEDK
jgi:hypothetical protein